MAKTLEGMTLDTVLEALRAHGIRPGQRFSITVDDPSRPTLTKIADRMRATAASRGMTTDIFDKLIAKPE